MLPLARVHGPLQAPPRFFPGPGALSAFDAVEMIVANTGAGEPRLAEVLPDVGWPTGGGAMLPPGEMCMNGMVNPLL